MACDGWPLAEITNVFNVLLFCQLMYFLFELRFFVLKVVTVSSNQIKFSGLYVATTQKFSNSVEIWESLKVKAFSKIKTHAWKIYATFAVNVIFMNVALFTKFSHLCCQCNFYECCIVHKIFPHIVFCKRMMRSRMTGSSSNWKTSQHFEKRNFMKDWTESCIFLQQKLLLQSTFLWWIWSKSIVINCGNKNSHTKMFLIIILTI